MKSSTLTRLALNPSIRVSVTLVSTSIIAFPALLLESRSAPATLPIACVDEHAEAQLRQRETALLGPQHAQEHAIARVTQCKRARGEAQAVKPSPEMLAAAAALSTSTAGQWGNPITLPVAGVTAVLLHTGKVLFWSYDPASWADPNRSNTGVAYIWDPAINSGQPITPPENIWCAGQTLLSDGRVYLAGGNLRYPDGASGWKGSLTHYTFNPYSNTWTLQGVMDVGRWYPTTTRLADNRVVVTSGFDESGTEAITKVVDVFTPSTTMDGVGTKQTVSSHDPSGLYPFQFLLSSGQMLQAGPDQTNTYLLTPDAWSWSAIPNMKLSHYVNGNGIIYADASVSPVKQSVLIAGGQSGPSIIGDIEMLDTAAPSAGWKAFPRWIMSRHNGNTVILPDGKLFTVGGNAATTTYDEPLFQSELYTKAAHDPTGSWVQVAPNTIQAAYHSSALLLPDAKVLLSQDDADKSSTAAHKVQIYSPPYLFNTDGTQATRPVIRTAPASVTWGQSFTVETDAKNLNHVTLVAPAAVTHSNDMHQRAIKLAARSTGRSGNVQVTLPTSRALVPAGYYMLFVVNSQGVPSVAKFVRVV